MSLEYSKAKNQSDTCKWNSFYLHSSYNPEIEAQRFVESLTPQFIPENIIIIEPALSYCVPYIKQRFPESKIFCIRFINDLKCSISFEKEFYFSSENSDKLKNDLFNYFGETGLLNSFFISWPPSSKAFSELDNKLWLLLKSLLKDCQSILATRQYFSKRWIKNQINYLSNLSKVKSIKKVNLPVLICASGISLEKSLPFIQKIEKRFFIIACSSAIKTLIKNNIIPDLCISTDGGFWAKKHLNCLANIKTEINLAVPSESNIPEILFTNQNINIIPLAYCDNFDNSIYKSFNIPYNKAQRNGTISGTAVELALSLSNENIFLCGIDLEASSGFVHTQPNELEIENSLKDIKIKPIDNRTFIQGRDSTQLEMYRNWFINQSEIYKNKVFRLSDNHSFKNRLGSIKDINFKNLSDFYSTKTVKDTNSFFTESCFIKLSIKQISSTFNSLLENTEWLQNYFPADCLMIKRSENSNQNLEYIKRLNEKVSEIKKYLTKMELSK